MPLIPRLPRQTGEAATRRLLEVVCRPLEHRRGSQGLEEVIGGATGPGIDYRMTCATGEDLNLHLDAHGDYDIGVFAHNLIRGRRPRTATAAGRCVHVANFTPTQATALPASVSSRHD